MLWLPLAIPNIDAAVGNALLEDATLRASFVSTVKLLLALLRVQSSPAARSSSSSSSSASKQWQRLQNALACTFNIAQAMAAGPCAHRAVRSQPCVQQAVASMELRQLLVATAAWLVGLLHQAQQGRASVDAAAVVRCLSNSSAAATYAMDTSSQNSSSNVVLPHHLKVLDILGVSALLANPLDPSSPASTQQANDYGSHTLRTSNILLYALFKATAYSVECSSESSTVDNDSTSLVPGEPPDTSSSSSSRGGPSTWHQLLPDLVRMLVELMQLGVPAEGCQAAMRAALHLTMQHAGFWQQPAGSAALSELVVQLGLPVLHAVQQQQQQQQQAQQQQQTQDQARHLAYALWDWATTMFNAVSTGGCSSSFSCMVMTMPLQLLVMIAAPGELH
jgi:hypothetical protein